MSGGGCPVLRGVQAVGIVSAAYVGGAFMSISYMTMPAIFASPTDLALSQWRRMFDVGKPVHATFVTLATSSFAYLAYRMKGTLNQHKAEMYGISALTSLAVLPLYLVIMANTNNRLLSLSDGTSSASDAMVKELMDKWSLMNGIRGGLMILSGFMAAWTATA